MLSAGVLGGLVADLYGAANVREIAFSFREPVLLGDVITCSALPADATPEQGETLLELQCLRASGEVAVAGSARVIGGPRHERSTPLGDAYPCRCGGPTPTRSGTSTTGSRSR